MPSLMKSICTFSEALFIIIYPTHPLSPSTLLRACWVPRIRFIVMSAFAAPTFGASISGAFTSNATHDVARGGWRKARPPPTGRNLSRYRVVSRSAREKDVRPGKVDPISDPSSTSRASAATADCSNAWERFYRTHSGTDGKKGYDIAAFKDRHYLRKEFVDLMPAEVLKDPTAWPESIDPNTTRSPDPYSKDHKVVLELGCGVGNSAFPLLRANLDLKLICVDCSQTAIDALKVNPEFDDRRCSALVAELGSIDAPLSVVALGTEHGIADNSIDAVTCVFFLSALDSDAFNRVATECARVLKPGGVLLFRDYAKDDEKNNTKSDFAPGTKIDTQSFVRGDGTLAVFTDEAFVKSAFSKVGLIGSTQIITHTVVNRKLEVKLDRFFVQGRFEKQ